MPGFEIPKHILEAVSKKALQGAPGAISIGTKVRKIKTEGEDEHPEGTEGTIIGSLDVRQVPRPPGYTGNFTPNYMYLVDFNDGKPVFAMDFKLQKI